jgi:hypothetical protein
MLITHVPTVECMPALRCFSLQGQCCFPLPRCSGHRPPRGQHPSVLCSLTAGANQPGVLDKLAGAVRDAAVSAAQSLVAPGDPAAAANLQPDIPSDSGAEAASPEQPPAAQSDVSMAQPSNGSEPQTAESEDRTDSSGYDAVDAAADPAIVGSQEWLAPQQQLPDQTPPEAGAAAAAARAAGDTTAQTSGPAATSPQQDQQQEQRQPPTDQQLDAVVAKLPEAQREAAKRKLRCSWDAKDARGGGGDFLFELGNTDYNTNVDVGEPLDVSAL